MARAQASPPSPPVEAPRHLGGQRSFGFGPILGWADGAGATVTAAWSPVGLWVSAGYVPVLVFGNKRDVARSLTFDAYSSGQVSFDVMLLPIHPTERIDAGLVAGYRYNSLVGHGLGLGITLTCDFSRILGGFFSTGVSVFPQADDRLSATGHLSDRDASLPSLQGGAQAGLVIYP